MTNESPERVTIDDICVPEEFVFPEFANAVRIFPEPGNDCIIEFLVVVAQEKKAKVVGRIRVRNDFLIGIRDTINRVLPKEHQQPMVHPTGQLLTADGQGITLFQPGGGNSGEGN